MKFRCYRVYESCAVCVSGLFYLAPGIIRGPGGLQNARPTVSDSFASHCLATSTHTQNCLEDSKEFWRKVDANSIEIAVVVWKRSNHLLIFFAPDLVKMLLQFLTVGTFFELDLWLPAETLRIKLPCWPNYGAGRNFPCFSKLRTGHTPVVVSSWIACKGWK